MVVHAPATEVFAFLGIGQTAHIAPVVISQKHNHIIGHTQAFVIVVLHFFIERPHLRGFLGGATGFAGNNLTLIPDDTLQQLGIGIFAHGTIAIATHANGHHIFRIFHAADAFAEELINDLLISNIVPSTILLAVAAPLLMIARHGFVVRGTDDHTHLITHLAVQGVVSIKSPAPHGGPQEIATQAEDELKAFGIELMATVVGAKGVLHPVGEARSLIVKEETTVFHGRFASGIVATLDGEILLFHHRYIGPPIPR